MEERVQKILAQAGFGSRRSCEALIVADRVKVNGVVALLGSKADAKKDKITVDDRPIRTAAEKVYIALNKPRGVLSDEDPADPRPTVFGLVPQHEHLFSVGRLDLDSEGLILLTNDGELANRLTHPRYGHEKEYRVLVVTRPDAEQLATWRRGVVLADGYRTRPAEVVIESEAGKSVWLRVVLREGRKRQIREVGNRIGLPVERILRVRISTLELGNLKPKEWRYLNAVEVARLKQSVAGEGTVVRRPSPARRRPVTRPENKPAGSAEERKYAPRPAARPGGHRPVENSNEDRPAAFRRPAEHRPAGGTGRPTSARRPAERRNEQHSTATRKPGGRKK